nr:M15 family metallopeptidase [Moraxella sp. CTOTU49097]
MSYQLSKRSLSRLAGVDDKLVAVVKRAIEISQVDFMVLEGVRSKEQCMINYGKGRTAAQCSAKGVPAKYANPSAAKVTWLNNPFASKHCEGKAVDLVPYPVDWNDLKKFDLIAQAMLQAAKELGVPVRWGADWNNNGKPRERGESDSPHFEI